MDKHTQQMYPSLNILKVLRVRLANIVAGLQAAQNRQE
jgi:hypothetical protein